MTEILMREFVRELKRQEPDIEARAERIISMSIDVKLSNDRRKARAVEVQIRERRDLC